CSPLIVGALLGLACFTVAFGATLFVFHHVAAQFAVGAERTAVGDHKFGFLIFFIFFCHRFPVERLSVERVLVGNTSLTGPDPTREIESAYLRRTGAPSRSQSALRSEQPCPGRRPRAADSPAPVFSHPAETARGPRW